MSQKQVIEPEEERAEVFSDDHWLDSLYENSKSENTRACAKTSLRVFEYFCQSQNTTKDAMIAKYQRWINQTKPDVRSICLSLSKLVSFMGKPHPEIMISEKATFKAKTPKTIKVYLGFLKSYLRICHDIRLTTDDMKDYVKIPKQEREPRQPVSLKELKLLFGKCDPVRRNNIKELN